MKVVMTLLVRNEEDILESHLAYHLSRGVDAVIVTDNLSDDATPRILEAFARRGRCIVLRETRDDYAQAAWVTRMARMAAEELAADWVIHSDADEFWWPKGGGTFKQAFAGVPPDVGIVEATRVNFLPRPEAEGPLFERMIYRDVVSSNPLGGPLPAKVAHRAHPEARVAQGNHAVEAPGLRRHRGSQPVCILHFPMRTLEQFTQKIVLGGRAYERNEELDSSIGVTWRRLYDTYRRQGLEEYWLDSLLSRKEIEEQIDAGAVLRDVRLREYLRTLGGTDSAEGLALQVANSADIIAG